MNNEKIPFRRSEVEEYEKKRYRGVDQKLVHAREKSILKRFLRLAVESRPRALDLPCGYGRFAPLLAAFGFHSIGSDISYHMVARAARPGLYFGESGPLGAVADAVKGLPFCDGVFGLIFSLRFFHHLHKREKRMAVLREFHRISDGWVILSFYRSNWIHRIQRKMRRKLKKSRTRISMITLQEWEQETREAGFRIVRIAPLFIGLHSQHIALLERDHGGSKTGSGSPAGEILQRS